MSRILKAYEARLRTLLALAGARQLEKGVRYLVRKSEVLSEVEQVSFPRALARVSGQLTSQLRSRADHSHGDPSTAFACDAGLGGLARWLRAAGYEAYWEAGIDDTELLLFAGRSSTTVLTTDSMLMERAVLRDGIIPAYWLPPTLKIPEQLALVFREFQLRALEPRCMACGGELIRRDKESLRGRIPPRTWLWLDEFFTCRRCDQLFWRGTHWERIRGQLQAVAAASGK